jgi:hypothetical protein
MTRWVIMLLVIARASFAADAPKADFSKVPGVVIDHSPASSGIYVGSPSIVIMPDAGYLASHDEFGPKSQYHGEAVTRVFRSAARGRTSGQIANVDG